MTQSDEIRHETTEIQWMTGVTDMATLPPTFVIDGYPALPDETAREYYTRVDREFQADMRYSNDTETSLITSVFYGAIGVLFVIMVSIVLYTWFSMP